MKTLRRAILAVAVVSFFVVLWKIPVAEVRDRLSLVGWGMLLVLAQEIMAHVFNAFAWRFAFSPGESGIYSLRELVILRIAGDGVNYLTPSGTIAGEFMRAQLLGESGSRQTRYGSVVVAKFTQSLGQAFFVLLGLALVVESSHPALREHQSLLRAARWTLLAVLSGLAGYEAWAWSRSPRDEAAPEPGNREETSSSFRETLQSVPAQCRRYFRRFPGRFAASGALFMAGYAWGAFEAYWICRFLGVPVNPRVAFEIEILSLLVDMMFFMVPAKVGTQEAGKTAIFLGLGLPPGAGFAFGLIRHVRELSWAGFGLFLCSVMKKRRPQQAEPAAVAG